jgi:phosphoglycerate dehydrogenase-like enzyme
MRPSSLVVGLVDEFNPELVDGFRSALPPGTTLVENALDSTTLDQVDYLVHWMKDIPDAVLGKVPVLRGVVKLDSGSGAAPSGLDRRGITFGVATSPALISVAEHTVMLILAVFKRLGTAIDRTRAGQLATGVAPKLTTQEEYSYNWVGLEKFEAVFGKTIGLVGLGRIGVEVARMLRGFNTDVVYTKRRPLAPDQENELGVRFLPFDDLLRTAHCVSPVSYTHLTLPTKA